MFGQVVVGPPGSGKSTYCKAMQHFLKGLQRKVLVVNLDPANHTVPYVADVNITELITVDDVMTHFKLGPNGALMYCVRFLIENIDWLIMRLAEASKKLDPQSASTANEVEGTGTSPSNPDSSVTTSQLRTAEANSPKTTTTTTATEVESSKTTTTTTATEAESSKTTTTTPSNSTSGVYVLFDCPGQVELYTHDSCMRRLLSTLTTTHDHRLVTLQLMDWTYCNDPGKYVSVVLTALNTMIQLETPMVSVLSKADLVRNETLMFQKEYFEEVMDLKYLVDCISDDPFMAKHVKLSEAICGVIENYGLVSFVPLDVSDPKSLLSVLAAADKANGFCFATEEERAIRNVMQNSVEKEDVIVDRI